MLTAPVHHVDSALRYRSGYYYADPYTRSTATIVPTSPALYLSPFFCYRLSQFDRIGIRVSVGVAASTAILGVYGSGRFQTFGGLIYKSASLATATNSTDVTETIQLRLKPGFYWLASVYPTGEPTVTSAVRPTNSPGIGTATPNGAIVTHWSDGGANAYTDLPDVVDPTNFTAGTNTPPLVSLRAL